MTASERPSRLLPAACILSAVVAAGALWYTAGFLHRIDSTLTELTRMADEPDELESSWLGTDGLNHKVTTKARAAETPTNTAERHAAQVAAMLLLFPKAP